MNTVINPATSISLVLVDANDKILGFKEKMAAHKIPVPLHRAISIVIVNNDSLFNNSKSEMLITKRAKTKPTWGGFWTNAVCSHPYPEETYQAAAERRLYEELGFKTKLKEVFKFNYSAEMDNKIWGEHELDHTFIGIYEGRISPDPREVDGYEWVEVAALKKDIKKNPGRYTPWFRLILKKLYTSPK